VTGWAGMPGHSASPTESTVNETVTVSSVEAISGSRSRSAGLVPPELQRSPEGARTVATVDGLVQGRQR
jgi:hypothetical protein